MVERANGFGESGTSTICHYNSWILFGKEDSDMNQIILAAKAASAHSFITGLPEGCNTQQLFLKGFGGDYSNAYSKATSLAREAISNIRSVAAFGAEDRISIQFASELNKHNKQALLRGHISGFGYGVTQLLAFCSYALGLCYASVLIKKKESNFRDVMKALIITALAIAETLALTPDIVKGSQALGSVFRILHIRTAINPNN
ncbi:hypothetical protein TSUD_02280 [Trifolium subterraneum]|nr:hypothetical protein TSUD_02280 [Trifolium subterraneum]